MANLDMSDFHKEAVCIYTAIKIIHVHVHVQYESKKAPVPFRSVFIPVSTIPVCSVHFRSNCLPRANSFSARHEFVCKIHCVRWRSVA